MPSKAHHTSTNLCPSCGYTLNAAGDLSNTNFRGPEPGDASMCIACGELLEFNDDMKLIILTDFTREQIGTDAMGQLLAMQKYVREHPPAPIESNVVH